MCLFKYFTSFKSIDHCPRKNSWENCIYHRHSFLWNFLSSNNRLKNLPQTGWNSSNHSECSWPSYVEKPYEIQTLYCSQGCNQWVWRFIVSKLHFIWEGNKGWNELKANWDGKIDLLLLISYHKPCVWTISPLSQRKQAIKENVSQEGGLKIISTTNTQTLLDDFISIHLQQWELYKIQKPEMGDQILMFLMKRTHISSIKTKKELS